MESNLLLIIHSVDETTEFLKEIPEFLLNLPQSRIEYLPIANHADLAEIHQRISDCKDGTTIVFLGHGASHCIYSANESLQGPATRFPLISNTNFQILNGKNFIALSCRSAEFILGNFSEEFSSTMLGFDDLPTHWEDVMSLREVSANSYIGMTDSVLLEFRKSLVEIFKRSLSETLEYNRDFIFFYRRLRLFTNLQIVSVEEKKTSDNPKLLAEILFELKCGISMQGKSNALL